MPLIATLNLLCNQLGTMLDASSCLVAAINGMENEWIILGDKIDDLIKALTVGIAPPSCFLPEQEFAKKD